WDGKMDRIDPFQFKFQFKNVEYSSGRNKTFLCYLVDKGRADDGLMRGYLEDEHSGAHAEQAFFLQTLPDYDPAVKYTVTWYMSSSPCAACAAKIAEALRARKTVKMTLFSARLFEWEEQEIQAGLNALSQAGCKLRMMKPMDFTYVWDTFVENNDLTFTLWEDCQDNYEYYHEKLVCRDAHRYLQSQD
uniref:Apolipoprotein B mRNA editing enzyme, catalytic polypeptide-like 2a n=1 Tax=Oncorhynchus tshawytscha TaxID=74940 RepID=A0A8C8M5S4_ONCTS